MEEVTQQFSVDLNSRLRDVEEKQRLLKDRVLLIGKGLVEDRQQTSQSVREIKNIVLTLKEENARLKEIIKNMTEQLGRTARKEELTTIQHQLDLLRTK